MNTKTTYFVFLFFVHIASYSQSDTLKCSEEFNNPIVDYHSSPLNLAYDGSFFLVSECPSGNIYKINRAGLCLDTLNSYSYNRNIIEAAGDNLWLVHDQTDWLCKLDKSTGRVMDSIKIEIPEVFGAGYQCMDICYSNSAIYSIWGYCYCGISGFLKVDLKTRETTDLGTIPLCDNLVTINDTIWAAGLFQNDIYAIFANNSVIETFGRSMYIGSFLKWGLAFDGNYLWVIDTDSNKFKKFSGPFSIETSVEETIKGNKIAIFPNPAYDYITINTDDIRHEYLIEIFDVSGRKIISEKQKTKIHKLDLREINPGVYIVRLSNRNQLISRSIIKK
jgi:glutamine cyclotransferase